MHTPNKVAILGAGWIGQALIPSLICRGFHVHASTRNPLKLPRLLELGAIPFRVELGVPETEALPEAFFEVDTLILSIPPGGVTTSYAALFGRMVSFIPTRTAVIFLSSTSVYGETQLDTKEEAVPMPESASGKRILEAEQVLQQTLGTRCTILRLAGLAGPGRHPGRWLAGKTGLENGTQPVNLVHQTDVCGVVLQVLEQQAWGQIFNVCADIHPLKQAYYPEMARAIGMIPPTFNPTAEAQNWKCIPNQKVKALLHYSFTYPDPREFPC